MSQNPRSVRRGVVQHDTGHNTVAESMSLAIEQIGDLAAELGADPQQLLGSVGYLPDHPTPEHRKLLSAAIGHLVVQGAEVTGCEHFGALVASCRVFPGYFGALGRLVCSARDLGAAIREFVSYVDMHADRSRWTLETDGELARLRNDFSKAVSPQIAEHNAVLVYRFLKTISQGRWQAHLVQLESSPRDDGKVLRNLLGGAVVFSANSNSIDFHSSQLAMPMPHADEELNSILHAFIDTRRTRSKQPLADKVEEIISNSLCSGTCSLELVSRSLDLSRSTLQRKLAEQDTGYQQILESVRSRKASELLAHTDITIGQLSERLGYANQSTFSRTFKQHIGQSPSQWRKSMKSQREGAVATL